MGTTLTICVALLRMGNEFGLSHHQLLISFLLKERNYSSTPFKMEPWKVFYKLIFHFQTQSKPAYCGLASLSMVLNALAIDPGRTWKGPWRWFDESMLDCCEPLEKVKAKGISIGKIACLAHCAGAVVQTFRTNESSTNEFRNYVKACPQVEYVHVVSSYHRGIFKQTGSGHFSPMGGYHVGRDMALILDVAGFKYPPHWVPLTLLWEAAKLGPEETLSDVAAADVHTIHKLEAVSAVFDPGKLVVMRMTIAASSWSGAGTWQTSLKHTLILSLEDKALEEGALIQGFSIFTVISLFGTGC